MNSTSAPYLTAPRSFLATVLARLAADADTVVLSDERSAYRGKDLLDMVSGLAHALAARGVTRGDRVALIAPTTVEAIAARYAAMYLGAATVFCPDAGSIDRLKVFLQRIEAQAVLVFPDTASTDEVITGIGEVHSLPDLLAEANAHPGGWPPHDELSMTDECVLVATGGTTGVSKASIRTIEQYTTLVDLGPTPGRRQLVCTPLAYIAQTLVDTVVMGGGHVVLRKRFDPPEILGTIAAEKVTHIALVEPLLVELLDCPQFSSHDLSSLVGISHVGADCAPSLRRRLLTRAGRPVLVNPYGASEFGVISMLAGSEYSLDAPQHLATSGRPLPFAQVQIVDDAASPAGTGQEGVICVRSPALAAGYSVEPDASGFGSDGWFRTGDVGVLDEDGYLHVRGRLADRRTVNGNNVFPVDIQDALCAHPDVRYAVALPDPQADNAFGAAIVLSPSATATLAEIREHLDRVRADLSSTTLATVTAIPTTEQGKPDRTKLHAAIWSQS